MVQVVVNYAPEKCGFCKGKALEFEREGDFFYKCVICKGAGTLMVAQPPQKCLACEGKAAYFWKDESYYYRCPMCRGRGWVHVGELKIENG